MEAEDEHELVPETPSADERGGNGFFSLSRLPIAATPRFVSNLIGANMAMLFGCSPNSDPHVTPSTQAKRVPIERSNSNTHSRAPAETASISVSIPSSADVSVDLADAPVDVSLDDIAAEDARSPHRRENAVKVFLRQRPSSPQLARAIHIPSKASTKCKSVSFRPMSFNSTQSDAEAVYTFDHVFQETADNEEVFRTTTLPLLVHLFDEPTPTDELILAYGPSGSGKTHTLSAILNKSIAFLVNRVNSLGPNSSAPSNIVPLHWGQVDVLNLGSADEVFDGASTVGEGSCSLWISFLEIHNDRCRDLLNPASIKGSGTKMNLDASTETPVSTLFLKLQGTIQKNLQTKATQQYFKNMTEYRITDLKSGVDIVNKVISARRTQETNVNKTSSRGHLITTIKLLRLLDAKSKPRISRISIADLAGSENSKKTGAEGATLSEAGHINKSLLKSQSAFEREKKRVKLEKIPYNSCQLTKSLQPFFRTGLVTFLFHIDPTNEDQTKAVLEFSHQTCQLVTFQPFSPTLKRKRGGDVFRSDARSSGDADYSAAQVAAELHRMRVRTTRAERERDTLALKNRELEAVLSEMEAQMRGLVENEGRRMKEEYLRIDGGGDAILREARARMERDCLEKMERRLKAAKGLLEMADEEELGLKEIELEQKDNELAQLLEMYDAREMDVLSLEDRIQAMTEKQVQDQQLATRELTISETVFVGMTTDAETQVEIQQESEHEPGGESIAINFCDAVGHKTGVSVETQTNPAATVCEKASTAIIDFLTLYEDSETQTEGCFDSSQGSSNPSDQPLADSQTTLTSSKSFDKNEHEEIEYAENIEPPPRRSRRISRTSLIPASDKLKESGKDLKQRRRSRRSSQSSPPVSASRKPSKRRAFGFAVHEHNGNSENEDRDGCILHDESKKLDHPETKTSTTEGLKLSFSAKTTQNPAPVLIPVGASRRTRALIGALQAGSRKPLDAVVGDGGVSASVSLSASIQKISVGVGGSNGSVLQPVSRQGARGSASVGVGKWGGLLRRCSSGVEKESETVSDETPELHIDELKVDEPVEEENHKRTRKLRTEKAMMPEDSPMPVKRRRRNVRK
ncbi:hypothetical protein CcCBS67573_g08713 [Chytriomyces confervae]|uniref:Kinesin motor domain-containing protein n=1 Tax=Chytriomyces confervae TaxID=246404 RepID=A0A507EHN5_9FUNG|nr:hypothetical protein CcCBS67573_g08713 [Chytriomyces confervae]